MFVCMMRVTSADLKHRECHGLADSSPIDVL